MFVNSHVLKISSQVAKKGREVGRGSAEALCRAAAGRDEHPS